MFLCFEIGFCLYQINSGTAVFSRNLNLGHKFLLSQDYDNAIRAFSKAIEIDGMNADAYIGRGDAYKAKGDYVSAWADYEKAQELSGDTDILGRKIGQTNLTIVSEDGDGIDGAAIKLNGNTHSYELVTDSSGSVSEILFRKNIMWKLTRRITNPLQMRYRQKTAELVRFRGFWRIQMLDLLYSLQIVLNTWT